MFGEFEDGLVPSGGFHRFGLGGRWLGLREEENDGRKGESKVRWRAIHRD